MGSNSVTVPLQLPNPIRVMVVDDHPIVRQGVRSLLSNCPDMELVAECDSGASALDQAARVRPDVILLDIRMPGMTGVEAVRPLFRQCPNAKILMLSSFDDEAYVDQAIQAGVHGYILKSASDETLAGAVRAAFRGERVLSPPVMDHIVQQAADYSRERARREVGLTEDETRVLKLLAEGASNPRIAAELYISETTVKRKLQDVFEKLGVATRAQAAAEAVRRELV
ncbi:MAG: response regulator transcription factor [Chloroflexi bacterium]|nr:response regulator transcription factor [Chloroflexota bacterium]MBI5292673.1 response regulator transcription factor [Chloroflexota bacterium]